MSVNPGTKPNGFTLLEVLVALVVLGLLMIGLTQGIRAGLTLRHAQSRRLNETAELDSATRVLRVLLSKLPTDPLGVRLIASQDGKLFIGETDRLSFVGNLPTGLGLTHRADMTLHVEGHRLVLSWSPHRHERLLVARQPPTETELLSGVERLDLAYWGSPSRGQPMAWLAHWESPAAPNLIRIRLVFAKGDDRPWPDLIIAPSQ